MAPSLPLVLSLWQEELPPCAGCAHGDMLTAPYPRLSSQRTGRRRVAATAWAAACFCSRCYHVALRHVVARRQARAKTEGERRLEGPNSWQRATTAASRSRGSSVDGDRQRSSRPRAPKVPLISLHHYMLAI
eukprot:5399075-Prymnesium_polylepis.3